MGKEREREGKKDNVTLSTYTWQCLQEDPVVVIPWLETHHVETHQRPAQTFFVCIWIGRYPFSGLRVKHQEEAYGIFGPRTEPERRLLKWKITRELH